MNINKNKLKKTLIDHCKSILLNRIEVAKSAMDQAQESANSEGKSSAGDKYETSRAMGQLDRDMNARQLEEANRDLVFISSINPEMNFDSVQTGSIVETEKFTYFISTGLGTLDWPPSPRRGSEATDHTPREKMKIIFLSPASPVAKTMEGKKAGENFSFNGQSIKILNVY